MRLGLVLAEVGEKAGIKVEDSEVGKALVDLVRQYPGQEQVVWEHYRKNPQALAEVKAPLFEEKVVDHIVAQAQVTERVVTREDLLITRNCGRQRNRAGRRERSLTIPDLRPALPGRRSFATAPHPMPVALAWPPLIFRRGRCGRSRDVEGPD